MDLRIGKETGTCNDAYLRVDPASGKMDERGKETRRVIIRKMRIVDLLQRNATVFVENNFHLVRLLRPGSRVTNPRVSVATNHSKLPQEIGKKARMNDKIKNQDNVSYNSQPHCDRGCCHLPDMIGVRPAHSSLFPGPAKKIFIRCSLSVSVRSVPFTSPPSTACHDNGTGPIMNHWHDASGAVVQIR